MPLTRDQIANGVTLRVIADRWDRPVGTIARVTDMGVISIDNRWWFTVEWLTYLPKRSRYSLRVWEEDLPSFELVIGPVDIPWPQTRTRKRDPFKFNPPSPQLSFPFVEHLRQ
jgi:hypothetical protein